jgi:hypothetical protein
MGALSYLFHSPALAKEVNARRRAEKPLFVSVRLLGDFSVQNHDHHVASLAQVLFHCFTRQTLVLGSVQ